MPSIEFQERKWEPGNLLEMQILDPHTKTYWIRNWKWAQQSVLTSPPGDSDAQQSVSTNLLDLSEENETIITSIPGVAPSQNLKITSFSKIQALSFNFVRPRNTKVWYINLINTYLVLNESIS